MTNFVRGANPLWYYVDLDANAFDDNFYMYVLNNEIPYQPLDIYADQNGTLRANPVQFLANGTLPIDVYWDLTKTYRLEFRQNDGVTPPSQADALIYLIENYSPLGEVPDSGDVDAALITNQITNAQFALFPGAITLTVVSNPDPIEVAPGWELVLAGTGSGLIERLPLTSATPTPTNAPYALRVNLTGGWSSAVLRQRFAQNGVLWANKYVSGAFTARSDAGDETVTLQLQASTGQPLAVLVSDVVDGSFDQFTGNALLEDSANTDIPPDAYIDLRVILPTVCDLYLTSFSLVATDANVTIHYGQETVNRQIDHTFNYYNPLLQAKQIDSYLVGWDFSVNPAQRKGTSVAVMASGANTSNYVWDQTIVFQTANSGVSFSRANNQAFRVTAAAATQFALVQYVDLPTARQLLNNRLSVNISATTSRVAGLSGTVSLWYTADASLPAMGSNASLVSALDADGFPTAGNGTWVKVPRSRLDDASFTLESTGDQTFNDYGFSGWDLAGAAAVGTTTFVAIVVGFEALTLAETVDFNSISLVPGDLPCRPAVKTADEVLAQCERFYEKSYAAATLPGAVTLVGAIAKAQSGALKNAGNNLQFVPSAFEHTYRTPKRSSAATLTLYSPSAGTASSVQAYVRYNTNQDNATHNVSGWTPLGLSTKGFSYVPLSDLTTPSINEPSADATRPASGWVEFHFVAEAGLGYV